MFIYVAYIIVDVLNNSSFYVIPIARCYCCHEVFLKLMIELLRLTLIIFQGRLPFSDH